MGLYTVDELELSGPPDTLTIRAKAANIRSSLKEHKTRAWDDTTLGDRQGAAQGCRQCRKTDAAGIYQRARSD